MGLGQLDAVCSKRLDQIAAPAGPMLWVLLDESALRTPFGGAKVMAQQMAHLIGVSKLPNVTLQLIRIGAERIAAVGSFTILRFGDENLPDIVYLEHLTGASYLDRRADVDVYLEALNRIALSAEPLEHTVGILGVIRESWEGARPLRNPPALASARGVSGHA
jgi:Domain of unknown function (DUF5753)